MYMYVHTYMPCTPARHLVLAASQRTTEANPEAPPEQRGVFSVFGSRLVPVDLSILLRQNEAEK